MEKKITILFKDDKITILYSLYPFWISEYSNQFDFTTDWNWVLNHDKNNFILLVRCFINIPKPKRIETLLKLKQKYQKVFLFDDNDGSESFNLSLLPFLDKFYKKQIFKNRCHYQQTFIGERMSSHYYHVIKGDVDINNFGFSQFPYKEEDLNKITLLWNLGIGQYPLSKLRTHLVKKGIGIFGKKLVSAILTRRKQEPFYEQPKLKKCHARFGFSEGGQREFLYNIIKDNSMFLVGTIPKKVYDQEIRNVQAVLSPFGWGEICFRDFEAILNGSVLIKPNMDHIETWPNIFLPSETYIPINWDGTDLLDNTKSILEDSKNCIELTSNAWEIFHNAYQQLDLKVVDVINEFNK